MKENTDWAYNVSPGNEMLNNRKAGSIPTNKMDEFANFLPVPGSITKATRGRWRSSSVTIAV